MVCEISHTKRTFVSVEKYSHELALIIPECLSQFKCLSFIRILFKLKDRFSHVEQLSFERFKSNLRKSNGNQTDFSMTSA